MDCCIKVTGRGAGPVVDQLTQHLDQLAGPIAPTDGSLSWACCSDWCESIIVPLPRGEIPLMVDRLVAGWSAYPVCAVACPAGLRSRAVDPSTVSALLAQIGYRQRVGERCRPAVRRPLTSTDPGCRLRLVSLSAEAAEHCFVRTGGAVEADAVARAAHRPAGNRLTAEEVFGDAHGRVGEQPM
eukprot:7693031-Alexandrium_andersonii.AAC.1